MSHDKTLINLDRAVIHKGGLRKFVELSWHQIEPGKSFVPRLKERDYASCLFNLAPDSVL